MAKRIRQIIKEVLKRIAAKAAIPTEEVQANVDFMQLGEKKEINVLQIDIDAAAISLILKSAGYTPTQMLGLMARMYGPIVGNLPSQTDIAGVKFTSEQIAEVFHTKCKYESDFYLEARKAHLQQMFPNAQSSTNNQTNPKFL